MDTIVYLIYSACHLFHSNRKLTKSTYSHPYSKANCRNLLSAASCKAVITYYSLLPVLESARRAYPYMEISSHSTSEVIPPT
jgi:hypothetical protein